MQTQNGLLVMDEIIILDATPAMADVISGTVPRPEPFVPRPELRWQKRPAWWHWAVKTHAGRKALTLIGCTVDVDSPWVSSSDRWRVQPWEDPGDVESRTQFGNVVGRLRDALEDPNAGTFFAEICKLDIQTCEYVRSHQTMVAVNIDGTRAAIAS